MSLSFRKLFLFVLGFHFCTSLFGEPVSVVGLRCNYEINPIDVDDFFPNFSWKFQTSARDVHQEAFQIIVSSSPDFNASSVLWNSGEKKSAESVNINYAGSPLKFGSRYYWKIKVWTNNHEQSNFSDPAFWEMILNPVNWTAAWISAPAVFDFASLNDHRYSMIKGEKHDFLESLPIYRKKFNTSKKIRQAKVYIAGLGFNELFLNGRKCSSAILDPAFTNYDKTVLYTVHDVTSLLNQGENAIGVILGNGWYNSGSKEVWGFDMAPWRNRPTLKLQLEITYDDETTDHIVSDETWLATPGPIAFSFLRQGEYYDARMEVPGWSEVSADEKNWKAARRVAGPIGQLKPAHLPPVKVTNSLESTGSKTLSNGHIVYDFGQNIAGFVAISVSGNEGSRVQFTYSELIDSTGAADQSNINNLLSDSLFQVDRYTLKGNGEETWSPKFVYHGFRYVEVSVAGQSPKILHISASAISTSFEQNGEFTCSSDLINRIQKSTLWSYRNNFVGFPTDCPQREKNGWTGDAQLACETGLSNFNTVTSYKKWLGDLRDEQQPDGSLPGIVPTAGWGYYWGNGPAWDIACIVIPWTLYVYTGDAGILEENYSMMKKYVDYVHSRSPEYLTSFGLGDWVPVKTKTPEGITSTGYFYYGASTVSKAAAILGIVNDKKEYRLLAENIKNAFNKKYYNPADFTYGNGSQAALSCALFHGLVPEQNIARVFAKLVAAVHAADDHVDCGILGARYLPHVLADHGNPSLAWKLISTRSFPGWGYWIENGATTLWEEWRGEGSQDHIMFGDVSSWFYKTVCGIQPLEGAPGFREFIIAPTFPHDLTWANGKYESAYGTIVSNWKIENNMIVHEVEVPPNSTATYYPPIQKIADLSENGKPIGKQWLTTATKNKSVAVKLASGKYRFAMRLPK